MFKRSEEIILGSLLGDGSLKIHKNYRNARFSFRHSIHQKDYFFWKASQLKDVSGENYYWESEDKDGFGGKKLRYQSMATQELTDLYNLICKNGRLKIQRRWLNLLTPLSLSIWWMDDGSIIGNGRKGVFCTESFFCEDQKILARYLKIVWKVDVHIGKIKRTWNGKEKIYYRLWIRSSEELKKFLRIILPQLKIQSMLPKFLILYKDIDLQQRWISEVGELTGFSKEIIEKHVSEKKNKWKIYGKASENDIVRSSEQSEKT